MQLNIKRPLHVKIRTKLAMKKIRSEDRLGSNNCSSLKASTAKGFSLRILHSCLCVFAPREHDQRDFALITVCDRYLAVDEEA